MTESEYEVLLSAFEKIENAAEENGALEDLLVFMGDLIDKYETENFDLSELEGELTDVEVLKDFMEARGITQKDLAPIFGTKDYVSDILKGKRKIRLRHVKMLKDQYNLPFNLFFKGTGKIEMQKSGFGSEHTGYISLPIGGQNE